tara:strand:+ start:5256 stop:7640 length:2385 start_codon:yes stop_codon:yes gene_type:complete
MAIDKNFVIKNGLEVNTNVLVAAADEKQVGIGTTRPYYKLHVGGGEGSRGGIGATDLTISGIATIGVAHSDSGAFRVLGISTFQGDIDLLGSAGVSTVRWDASENRLEFKDNASVGFGTGNDLTLWHDGSVSYIKDTVGDFRIAGDKITLELEDGTNVKVIDQFGVNITGVTTTNRLYVSGIATVGTALSLTDNVKAQFGAGGDLSIYHDGSHSYIKDSGTGDLTLIASRTIIGNAANAETIASFTEDGSVDLYYDNTKTFETSPQGVIVSGVTTSNRVYVTGISTFIDDVDFDSKIRFDESESALTFTDGTAIRVGTGSDFSIIHDGSNTILRDSGTGDVKLYSSKVEIGNAAGTESGIIFTQDGSVDLYYDNTERLSTTAIGATVFGDLVVAGVTTAEALNITGIATVGTALSLADNVKAQFGTGGDLIVYHDGSHSYIKDGGTGDLTLIASRTIIGNAANAETIASFTENDSVKLYFDNTERLSTTAIGATVFGDFITSGVGTFGKAYVTGIATFASDVNVLGNLNVTGDITYDEISGRNLNITGITTLADQVNFGTSGVGATIFANGNVAISGITTINGGLNVKGSAVINSLKVSDITSGRVLYGGASGELQDNANLTYDGTTLTAQGVVNATRFIGIHTSADGGGIGIGSTTAHVGYGITYIDFKGPGVSTVYSSSVTGITTIYFQGGGGSSVGAAGTWQNDGAQGISTAKSVGINTVGVAVTALQGGEKGASSGIGQTFQGLYISNGMVVNDNQLNGNHYIGTAFGGVMAGPVTVNGIITVDGNWAVV